MSRPRDEIWDQLDLHFGPCRTATEASLRGKTVKELREAGATVEEIDIAYEYCKRSFDIFSEMALVKNFSRAQHEAVKARPSNLFSIVEKMANTNLESQVATERKDDDRQ